MTDPIVVPWPPPGFEVMLEIPKNRRCLFCEDPATKCFFFRSDRPYSNFTIANRFCNDWACLEMARNLTEAFIRFDEELNAPG